MGRLTPESKALAIKLRDEGWPMPRIAAKVGITYGAMWRFLDTVGRTGIRPRPCPSAGCSGLLQWDAKARLVCDLCGHLITRWAKQSDVTRAKDRERKRVATAVKRQSRRDRIRAAKAQPCTDCGGSWPYFVMHFDHVRGEKKFGIARTVGHINGITSEQLDAEIAKCDVVCANCHAMRHGNRSHLGLAGKVDLPEHHQQVLTDVA